MTEEHELGRMGQYVRTYKPGVLSIHRTVNDLFGQPSRQVFPASAVIIRRKKIPDVAFYQGDINFDVMRSKTDAIIVRAGQNLWEDTKFRRNWTEAKQRGMLRGTYFFYDDRVDPGRQADLWHSLLKDDPPEMEVIVDWERSYGGAFGGLRNVVAMMQRMVGYGYQDALYTGYYWFRENSNAVTNAAQYAYLKDQPLHLAWYVNDPSVVLIPNPFTNIWLWQFDTPDEDWGQQSEEIDMNYVNMDESEFYHRYAGGVVIPPPETGEPTMPKNRVTITWDQGARERKEPRVQVAQNTYRHVLPDNSIHYSDFDEIPDADEPFNPDKRWIKLQSGWYIATRYPSSAGNPVRALVEPMDQQEPEPPPPPPVQKKIVKADVLYDDGSSEELFPR